MAVTRSLLLFVVAALAEIGGAWLVWQGVREHRGWVWIGGGILALGAYGFVATLQPDSHFGRILAAYGGVFVAGSLLWGVAVDGFRSDRYDVIGALVCLVGVAVIMYAPRTSGRARGSWLVRTAEGGSSRREALEGQAPTSKQAATPAVRVATSTLRSLGVSRRAALSAKWRLPSSRSSRARHVRSATPGHNTNGEAGGEAGRFLRFSDAV